MIVYLFVLFLLFYNRNIKNFSYLPFIILLLLSMLRDVEVGVDTVNYVTIYKSLKVQVLNYEVLFYGLLDVFRYFGLNVQTFIAITSFLILLPIFIFIKLQTKHVFFSFLVFFILTGDNGYLFTLSGMRQSLTIGLVLISFYLFQQKKKFPFILAISIYFVTYNIHRSSVFPLLIALVAFLFNFNKRSLYFITLFLFFLSLMVNFGSVSTVFNYFPSTLQDQFSVYSNYSTYTDNRGLVARLVSAFPLTFIAIFSIYKNLHNEYLFKVFYIGLLGLLILNSFPVVNRLFLYTGLIQIVIWPQCYALLKNKNEKIIFNLGLILVILIYLYDIFRLYHISLMTHKAYYGVPYKFFFE